MSDEDVRLKTFLTWCKENHLILNSKVKVGKRGSCHRYGLVATEDIQENECLFSIPRTLVLEPRTCSIAHLIQNLDEGQQQISDRGSGWIPLLLALMYEFTNASSFWRPYLDIVPDLEVLDQPMFWSKKDRENLLKDTQIAEDVEQDLECIEKEYHKVVKRFIKSHHKNFSTRIHTLDLYKHMAAFVMAYSFTENSPGYQDNNAPVMVPMADILNHHSNNNAHLEFEKDELKMVSIQPIAKGQEVYNTYGQLANCHLLQSYGFVEQSPNPNDTIEIPLSMFYDVLQRGVPSKHEARLLDAKFQFMEEMGLISDDDGFVFDLKGCQKRGTDLTLFLKFLHLTDSELHTLINPEDKDKSLTSDLSDLLSHFEQFTEQQTTSSCETLAKVLKPINRKRKTEIIPSRIRLTKKLRPGAGDMNSEMNEFHKNFISSDNCGSDDNSTNNANNIDHVNYVHRVDTDDNDVDHDDDDNDVDHDDDDNSGDDEDHILDSGDDSNCYDDSDDSCDDNSSDSDTVENVYEAGEVEHVDHVTYDRMIEYPLKWKQTLWSVAGDCSSKIDALLKEKNIDVEHVTRMTSRQLAVKQMMYGLKNILELTCTITNSHGTSGLT